MVLHQKKQSKKLKNIHCLQFVSLLLFNVDPVTDCLQHIANVSTYCIWLVGPKNVIQIVLFTGGLTSTLHILVNLHTTSVRQDRNIQKLRHKEVSDLPKVPVSTVPVSGGESPHRTRTTELDRDTLIELSLSSQRELQLLL